MKRFMALACILMFILCVSVYAGDKSASLTTKPESDEETSVKKMIPSKTVKMRAMGIVTEISDTIIKINRTVKGSTELMEFELAEPAPAIKTGDAVNVIYITKNSGNMAVKVYPVKKYIKKLKYSEKATPNKEAPAIKK